MKSAHYLNQVEMFRQDEVSQETTIFMGNSLMKGFDHERLGIPGVKWAIGGDVLDGLEWRMHLLEGKTPKRVILCLGINDILNGFGFDIDKVKNFINQLRKQSPETELVIMSLSPENLEPGFFTNPTTIEKQIREANKELLSLCESKDLVYVDVYAPLQVNGRLVEAYSTDGIHLTPAGYDVWFRELYQKLSAL